MRHLLIILINRVGTLVGRHLDGFEFVAARGQPPNRNAKNRATHTIEANNRGRRNCACGLLNSVEIRNWSIQSWLL